MVISELTNNIQKGSLENSLKTLVKGHIYDIWANNRDKKKWNLVDLKLDIVGDETLRADCDVTDHYVESNKAYQDQVTLKPKTYTISGEVGELVWYRNSPISQTIGQVAQKLEGVISFLPIRSKSFNQMKKTVMKASQWADTASNALQKLSSLTTGILGKDIEGNPIEGALTRQAQAYQYLVFFRDNRMPLSVRTPWGILNDYVITNLEFKQPKESKDKSFITITFKEFRTTKITTVEFDESKYQGNAALENQPKQEQGKTAGEDKSLPTKTVEDKSGNDIQACFISDGDGNESIATLSRGDGFPDFETKKIVDGDTLYVPVNRDTYEYDENLAIWANQCSKQVEQAGYEGEK